MQCCAMRPGGLRSLVGLEVLLQCYCIVFCSVVRVMRVNGAYAYIWSVSRVLNRQAFARAKHERCREYSEGGSALAGSPLGH